MNLPDSRTTYLVLWIFLFIVVFIEKSYLHFFESLVVAYVAPPVAQEPFKRQFHVDGKSDWIMFNQGISFVNETTRHSCKSTPYPLTMDRWI